ncbi:MAG TPA: hypothetical protein VE991_07835 [Acidimicrobiales bacterium]|nr:hypothetical protein [Acidimicrobiales bacterium]
MSRLATRFRSPVQPPTGANGDGVLPPAGGSGDEPPRRPAGPSAKPAAVVFAVILVIFLAGAITDGFTSSHHSATPARVPNGPVAGSGGLRALSAAAVLRPITRAGEPPSDILAAVAVPAGSLEVPGTAVDHTLGLYDASVTVQMPAAEANVIGFLRSELAATHWRILSSGARSDGGYQFLAQHPGSDGNEWELGMTLSPTAFSSAVPGVGAPSGGVTSVVVRLYVVSDQS